MNKIYAIILSAFLIYVKNPTDNIVYEIMEPKLSNGDMWVDGRSYYLFDEKDIKWR